MGKKKKKEGNAYCVWRLKKKRVDTFPKNVYYVTVIWGSGGMVYTGDLKSPADKVCGFKSRLPY